MVGFHGESRVSLTVADGIIFRNKNSETLGQGCLCNCSVIGGGPAPLIATALLAAFGSGYVIAVYILFCATVSVIATVLLPDYTNCDISEEYA